MSEEFILNRRVEWVKYPKSYLKLVSEKENEFYPWYFTVEEHLSWSPAELKKRYPSRDLFCFARKEYSDDIACWEKGHGDKVFIIHDFASPGWEQREIFDNFDEWYKWALTQKEEY